MGNSIDGFSENIEPPVESSPKTQKLTEKGYMSRIGGDKYDAGGEHSDIRFAVSSMQGWRATMEDTHILSPSLNIPVKNKFKVLADHGLFCVFDGHGGNFTSDYASKNFSRIFTSRPELQSYVKMSEQERREVPGLKLLKDALRGAFFDIDTELKLLYQKRINSYESERMSTATNERQTRSNCLDDERDADDTRRDNAPQQLHKILVDRSGSTAVMVLLTPHHIICCNAGDSRAILCKGGQALPLSFDHKPNNPTEINRVKEAGGFVKYKRVDGDLAVSRGLGDFRFKMNSTIPEQQKVSVSPEIIVSVRNDDKDQFLVIGCDGIWDVVGNQDCAEIIKNMMDEGEHDVGEICENMLDICLNRNSKDNMTLCVVTLPGYNA
jgi:Serine/threonine protein phosphatase